MAVARPADSVDNGLSRFALPLAGLAGLFFIGLGVVVLIDPHGGENLLANIYDLIGNSAGATALRNGQGDQLLAKLILAAIALVVGIGGVWLFFTSLSSLASLLRPRWRDRVLPWIFVVPALLLLTVYLVYPALATIWRSFFDKKGNFTFDNYSVLGTHDFFFLDLQHFAISGLLVNNVIWLVVATGGSVILGLIIAGLFDRVRLEALAKTFVFLPLAISLIGASVIWLFVYAWQPAGQPQYGLLNAIVTTLGGQPIAYLTTSPFNIPAEIVIMVWLQTGFAMVVLSAAIKGVSVEVIEAARLDGASERQIFFGVIVPIIRGSIITVATTIAIAVLKIFDIVYVTSGGRNHDDVVAVRMFHEMFQFFNDGHAAALATVLFLAVLPVMYINLRNFRRQQREG